MLHKLFARKPPVEPVQTLERHYDVVLPSPDDFRALVQGSRIKDPFIWYEALYIVKNNPDVRPGVLQEKLGVAYATGKLMIEKLKTLV